MSDIYDSTQKCSLVSSPVQLMSRVPALSLAYVLNGGEGVREPWVSTRGALVKGRGLGRHSSRGSDIPLPSQTFHRRRVSFWDSLQDQ